MDGFGIFGLRAGGSMRHTKEMQSLTDTLIYLREIIAERRHVDPEVSYIAKLFRKGRKKMAQKVGEEAVEVVIASMRSDKAELISESADLLFHLLVLWEEAGVTPEELAAELSLRKNRSGIVEKKNRPA
jgi:phosphoribosyl-ATP pyrophosphohydrolase